MIKNFAIICALAAAVTFPVTAEEVDLQLQRREDQTVHAVPGHKVDHKGIVINPTPQQLVRDPQGRTFDTSRKKLKIKSGYGVKAAAKAGVKPCEGAYRLRIDGKGAEITG